MGQTRISRRSIAIVTAALCAGLGGCGTHGKGSGTATQAVARVNGHEVTVSQLNQVLQLMRVPKPDPTATQQALSRLVTQELAVQAALHEKLDRDPAVALKIAAAKTALLAQAYEERALFPKAAIRDDDLRRFYDANPELFSARRVYHLAVFETAQSKLPDTVLAQLRQAHSVEAVQAVLSRNSVAFRSGTVVQGAEGIAKPLLPRLASAGVGDVVLTDNAGGHTQVLLLTQSEGAAVSFDQVKAGITRYMIAERNQAAIDLKLAQLRAAAKIEYVGAKGS